MTKYLIMFLLLLASELITAQIISGKVIDSQTKKALPYVNIGILHKNIGTVSDINGGFKLETSKALPSDTLKMSCIGYTPLIFPLKSSFENANLENQTFELDFKSGELSEVIIRPGNSKTKILGNKIQNSMIVFGVSSYELGAEVGTVLSYNKKNVAQLRNVNFYITKNEFDTLVFRVNLYEFKNGLPGESILKEPIYIKTTIKKGVLSLELSDYQIYIKGNSFISLEWISDSNDFSGAEKGFSKLHFSAGFINNESYGRMTSQGDWKKLQVGLGFWTTVTYKK